MQLPEGVHVDRPPAGVELTPLPKPDMSQWVGIPVLRTRSDGQPGDPAFEMLDLRAWGLDRAALRAAGMTLVPFGKASGWSRAAIHAHAVPDKKVDRVLAKRQRPTARGAQDAATATAGTPVTSLPISVWYDSWIAGNAYSQQIADEAWSWTVSFYQGLNIPLNRVHFMPNGGFDPNKHVLGSCALQQAAVSEAEMYPLHGVALAYFTNETAPFGGPLGTFGFAQGYPSSVAYRRGESKDNWCWNKPNEELPELWDKPTPAVIPSMFVSTDFPVDGKGSPTDSSWFTGGAPTWDADKSGTAYVAAHEFAHFLGMEHSMARCWRTGSRSHLHKSLEAYTGGGHSDTDPNSVPTACGENWYPAHYHWELNNQAGGGLNVVSTEWNTLSTCMYYGWCQQNSTPSAPRNIVATRGVGRVTLTWDRPLYNGVSPIVGYCVYVSTFSRFYKDANDGCISDGNATSMDATTIGGQPLRYGTQYYFYVRAKNTNSSYDPDALGPRSDYVGSSVLNPDWLDDTVLTSYPTSPVLINGTIAFCWVVHGRGQITHSNVHWGTSPALGTETFAQTGTASAAGQSWCDSIQAPSQPGTVYLQAHAAGPSNSVVSTPVATVTVYSPNWLTVTSVTSPPASVTTGQQFQQCWRVDGTGSISHTELHYGTTTSLGSAAPAPALTGTATSGGTQFCTMLTAPSSAGTLYLQSHAVGPANAVLSSPLTSIPVVVPNNLTSTSITSAPPSVTTSANYSVCWLVVGTGSITHTDLHWGTSSTSLTNNTATRTGTATTSGTQFCETLTAPAATGTVYLQSHAIGPANAVQSSPLTTVTVTAPQALTGTYLTRYPPPSVPAGYGYSVCWQVDGTGPVSHTEVHWGTSSTSLTNSSGVQSGTAPFEFCTTLTAPASPGTVYLRSHASGPGTDFLSSITSLTITASAQNDCGSGGDAGADFAGATTITLPKTDCPANLVSGTDNEDWYQFYAVSGQTISLSEQPGPGTDFDLCLFTPGNAQAQCSQLGGTNRDVVTYPATSTGMWRARVWVFNGSGPYTMSVSVAQNDCTAGGDAGNTFAAASTIGLPKSGCWGALTTVTDTEDWYQFYAVAGQTISVSEQPFTSGTDFDLCLYTPANVEMQCSRASGTALDSVTQPASTTGYYRARVYIFGGSGGYTFSASTSNAVTIRYDDGSADSNYPINYFDDVARKRLDISSAQLSGKTTATLYIYAQSVACPATGNKFRLRVTYSALNYITDFNPCDAWSSSGYSWKAFNVPIGYLGAGTNTFDFEWFSGDWSTRDINMALDTTGPDYGRSDTSYDNITVNGELMWYLVLT